MNKKIAIFGHREIAKGDNLEISVNKIFVQNINNGNKCFLFGSRSKFNDLCYNIILQLQKEYSDIKKVGYLCSNEIAFTLEEKLRYEKYNSRYENIKTYEEIKQFEFENRNLYIERNKKMIDDADICVFYYKKSLLNPQNKFGYKTKSGTQIALEYAKLKNKEIIIINK